MTKLMKQAAPADVEYRRSVARRSTLAVAGIVQPRPSLRGQRIRMEDDNVAAQVASVMAQHELVRVADMKEAEVFVLRDVGDANLHANWCAAMTVWLVCSTASIALGAGPSRTYQAATKVSHNCWL